MPPGARPSPDPSALVACRECRAETSAAEITCPHCGAPRPSQASFSGEGYEWKSRGTWMGEPLMHIAFGMDVTGRPRTARGVIAIGQRAVGGIAIGIMATGFIAIGLIACGMFSVGLVAVAALASFGVNSFAPLAFGVVAIGWHAHGFSTFGWRVVEAVVAARVS